MVSRGIRETPGTSHKYDTEDFKGVLQLSPHHTEKSSFSDNGVYGSSKKMVGKLNRYNFCSMPDRKFYPSSF